MAVNIGAAEAYISLNCIVIEDWTDSDEATKQRILNVAARTLSTKYPKYTIPDNAVYEFANVLATVFNDTNKLAKQGITSFQIDGVGQFVFNNSGVTGPDVDISRFIPQSALDIIGAENGGITIGKRRVSWSVM